MEEAARVGLVPLIQVTGNNGENDGMKTMAEEQLEKGDGTFRGHDIMLKDGQWVYVDTGEPTPGFGGEVRPCKLCGSEKWSGDGHVDECLGTLPGVTNACCGHGDPSQSYVVFDTGVVLRKFVVAEPINTTD